MFDNNGELKTINATLTASEVLAITDSNLATLAVAGTAGTLTLSSFTSTKLATITVSGAAGFNDNGTLATDAALTSGLTTTSSGTITAALNDLTQTFAGGAGQDIITITTDDVAKTITGGTATNNELILNAAAGTFTTKTNTNVTGFQILGLTNASTGTWNMSTLNSTFNSIDFDANGSSAGNTYTIINAAAGTALSIDNSVTQSRLRILMPMVPETVRR